MATEPVALSRDLPAGRVMRVSAGGSDIALWRGASDRLAAWANRCPHRGMRLSHGFVRGDSLACLYHGWHYDGGGKCTYIPAHPDLDPPATIRVQAFGVTERKGIIWVSIGDQSLPEDPVPAVFTPVRSMTFTCRPEQLRHAFAHPVLSGLTVAGCTFEGARLLVELAMGNQRLPLHGAVQSIGKDATRIHFVLGCTARPEVLTAISQWCEAARRRAEAEAAQFSTEEQG